MVEMPEPTGKAGSEKSIAKSFASTHSAFAPAIRIAVRPCDRSVTVPMAPVTTPAKAAARPSDVVGDQELARCEAECRVTVRDGTRRPRRRQA